jgi:hypothetical protein
MRFDSSDTALGILMSTLDMIPAMAAGKLAIDGAPEIGAAFSNLLFTVAYYAQGTYLDDQK